jgi:succinate dehydrogenase flavin-adding protein (antitoxin of CptAB toxin-antitoxin module)
MDKQLYFDFDDEDLVAWFYGDQQPKEKSETYVRDGKQFFPAKEVEK